MSGVESRRLLQQIKARNFENYPISNQLLKEETDYIKQNYYRHLALILTQKGDVDEKQRYLFSRMLVGIEAEETIEEYLRQALVIQIDQYVEFMDQMKTKDLRYRFLVDAILLVCCEQQENEQVELLAAFIESLKLCREEVKFLCAISRSILEQDTRSYWKLLQKNEGVNYKNAAQEYAVYFAGEYFDLRTDDSFFCYFPEKQEIDREFLEERGMANGILNGLEEVNIANATFSLYDGDFLITNCRKIVFENCDFFGDEYGINFSNDMEIIFQNCFFMNFERRAVRIYEAADTNIKFIGCKFEECYFHRDDRIYSADNKLQWKIMGGVIWANKCAVTCRIEETTFESCGVVNHSNAASSAIIYNQPANVKNCRFQDCWGYNNTDTPQKSHIDTDRSYRTLFVKETVDEGNTRVNSAYFSEEILV